ncbi:hypothetical protein CJ030_MR3G017048 [Morella rubra]|uniref:UBN2 domain-containing protein n=1 Tax=Morella rubra TaxID=262757 RepID=A0A6A1W4Q5_9ROSI|nr:hypothetical protein CJ030_MR3G017048 [Morella rubra]
MNECNWNSNGLHSIFIAISLDEFKRISMCETSKEAWDILEATHEGIRTVKHYKLQMLTMKFEDIRMKEDEIFDEFYVKLNDIVNLSYNLDQSIIENRIARKFMRSLPERFKSKVTAIKESKDFDKMKIEELVGSLQTYELTLPHPKRNKSIALRSSKEEVDSESNASLDDENFSILVKKFRKFLRSRGVQRRFNKNTKRIMVALVGSARRKEISTLQMRSRIKQI